MGLLVTSKLQVLRASPVEAGRTQASLSDDLSRGVFGVLGIPIDALDFPGLLDNIDAAKLAGLPFLISTPNVNFLIKSQADRDFRHSLLVSDLCLADGMPLIWIAKMLRIPIRERIAGSDLFGRLKSAGPKGERPLRVFLLGGAEGLAAEVCAKLNAERVGMECVGALNPGFGTIEELSSAQIIDAINASKADLIAVFFGAEKAQAWLLHNHSRLKPPVRAQFGATINFEAGTVRRAPQMLRSTGFEWLWRIKEEPYLWRRYWNDGIALLRLMLTGVLPLMLVDRSRQGSDALSIATKEDNGSVILQLSGAAVSENVPQAIERLRAAFDSGKRVVIDLTDTEHVDARFIGLFLMTRKHLASRGQSLSFIGASPRLRRIFRLSRFEYLLSAEV